jgi:hypothetical protein
MDKRVLVAGCVLGCVAAYGFAVGCGGEVPPVETPPLPSASAAPAIPSASEAPVASAAPSAVPTTAPTVSLPPPPKGTVVSFALSAQSGKVDKIGGKDGNFKPDGVKDTVFDLEYEGMAKAIFVMTTDAEGQLTSEFDADTRVGDEAIPKDLAGIMNLGKNTAGLGVFENGKLVNAKDGGLGKDGLADGKHKLTLHVSVKDFPKSAVRVFVLNQEDRVVKGPVLPAAAPAPKGPAAAPSAKPATPATPPAKPATPPAKK